MLYAWWPCFMILQMYGARPIRRWVQKNVMTRLSEMVVKGEVDAGSTISIDATDDKKALKYEVAKKQHGYRLRKRRERSSCSCCVRQDSDPSESDNVVS